MARVLIEGNKAEAAERFRSNREHRDAELARLDAAIQQGRGEVIASCTRLLVGAPTGPPLGHDRRRPGAGPFGSGGSPVGGRVASPDDTLVAMEALDELGGRTDFAVLSVGSPDTNSSAFSLAHSTDLAVVVATAGLTPFAAARRTTESLRQAGVHLVASLLADRRVAHRRP